MTTSEAEDAAEKIRATFKNVGVDNKWQLKTYLLRSFTNYGEVVHVVNAENEDEVRKVALNHPGVWEGYSIEELNTVTKGIVAVAGGDGG